MIDRTAVFYMENARKCAFFLPGAESVSAASAAGGMRRQPPPPPPLRTDQRLPLHCEKIKMDAEAGEERGET